MPPWQYENARYLMQKMLDEKHLIRAAIIDDKGNNKLSIGYQDQAPWPALKKILIFLAR
jgi:two-component system sensor histidine kinase BarA